MKVIIKTITKDTSKNETIIDLGDIPSDTETTPVIKIFSTIVDNKYDVVFITK